MTTSSAPEQTINGRTPIISVRSLDLAYERLAAAAADEEDVS